MDGFYLGKIGRCIYCGDTTSRLSREHIIPYGLGGRWILDEASCIKCAAITSKFEFDVQRRSLQYFRASHGLPTRRPDERPKVFTVSNRGLDGQEETMEIPMEEANFPLFLLTYPLPAYIDKREYSGGVQVDGIITIADKFDVLLDSVLKGQLGEFGITTTFKGHSFERMLLKIGYGFAVAHYGLDQIEEAYVLPSLLGQTDDVGLWMGCNVGNYLNFKEKLPRNDLHVPALMKYKNNIIARINLFSIYNTPEYIVVVGRLVDDDK